MNESLLYTAQAYLTGVASNPDCNGAVIVASKSLDRARLFSWFMTYVALGYPRQEFRALYVGTHMGPLEQVCGAVRRARGSHTDEQVVPQGAKVLPRLQKFNFITPKVALRLADAFPSGINLVVLDERRQDEMTQIARLVQRIQPDLTVVVTRFPQNPGDPWKRFGKPLLLSGATQRVVGRGRLNPGAQKLV